jgi:hypothetical protein
MYQSILLVRERETGYLMLQWLVNMKIMFQIKDANLNDDVF